MKASVLKPWLLDVFAIIGWFAGTDGYVFFCFLDKPKPRAWNSWLLNLRTRGPFFVSTHENLSYASAGSSASKYACPHYSSFNRRLPYSCSTNRQFVQLKEETVASLLGDSFYCLAWYLDHYFAPLVICFCLPTFSQHKRLSFFFQDLFKSTICHTPFLSILWSFLSHYCNSMWFMQLFALAVIPKLEEYSISIQSKELMQIVSAICKPFFRFL